MFVPRTWRILVVVVIIVGIVFIIFERHGLLTNKLADQIILFMFFFPQYSMHLRVSTQMQLIIFSSINNDSALIENNKIA